GQCMSWSLRIQLRPAGHMDELYFTNPECPKVTPIASFSGLPGSLAFTAQWPSKLITINVIATQTMTAGTDVSTSEDVSETSAVGNMARAGTDSQEMQLCVQIGSADRWIRMLYTNRRHHQASLFDARRPPRNARRPPRSFLYPGSIA